MTRTYKTTYEDIYKLHAKYGRIPPEDRDCDYWDSFASELTEYSKRHNDKFTSDLLVAVNNELEREYNAANSGKGV